MNHVNRQTASTRYPSTEVSNFQVFTGKKPAALTRPSQPINFAPINPAAINRWVCVGFRESHDGGASLPLGGKDQLARLNGRYCRTSMPRITGRWLTRNEHDAQEYGARSLLRAFRFFDGFHGVDARAWLLTIVRNHCTHGWSKTVAVRL